MIKLRENEKVYLIKRRHLMVFLIQLLPIAMIMFLLFFFLIFLLFTFPNSWQVFFTENISLFLSISPKYFILLLFSCLLMICWQIAFLIIVHYFLDCWIVTDKRTIHYELTSLFHRKYSTIDHDKIQDITVKIQGFLATIFKYGDLRIQTAGAFKEFIFKKIPDPYKTKEIIIKAQHKEKVEN
ncbi:MAG: PH domain-containing protein [Candidatus Pacebacteria bacterium]|nr:PH domain-containing protein [Candidatus Paceibacterota bacterium]